MSGDPEARLEIAARVADGSDVDWARLFDDRLSPDDRDTLAELKDLAALSAVHRTLAIESADGDRSWGSLKVLELRAEGRYGQVYRAWEPTLSRFVALKLLSHSGPDAFTATRAIDEARRLARVRHPNVVIVHGAEWSQGRVGIWTEFIEGQNLESFLRERGPLGVDDLITIGRDIAAALAAVHAAGLLHRDVKAQNIMREVGGRFVLMDFGTSHDADTASLRSGDLSGTPLYLAPELFTGGVPSEASDVYALAVLLFHLATGRFPFEGNTLEEVRNAAVAGAVRQLRELRRDLPRWLASAIERGLSADASARFSADELQETLSSGKAHNRRTKGTTLATIVVSVAALGAAAWWLQSRPPYLVSSATSQVLTFVGDAVRPVVTRPGDRVFYIRQGRVNSIWVHQVRSTASDKPLFAASDGQQILGLTPSPDGKFVDALLQQPGDNPDLWRIPSDGGTMRKIASAVVTPPGWSTDGSRMAFVTTFRKDGKRKTTLVVSDRDGTEQLPIYTPEDEQFLGAQWARRPTNRPAWSADDSTIAIGTIELGRQGEAHVTLIDVQRHSIAKAYSIVQPSMSQPELLEAAWLDPSRLLVSQDISGREGTYSLGVLTVATGEWRPITSDPSGYEGLSISNDGTIVTTRRTKGPIALWLGDGSGDQMDQILPDSLADPQIGAVSDNGQVFLTTTSAEGKQVRVWSPDYRDTRFVTTGEFLTLHPNGGALYSKLTDRRGIYLDRRNGAPSVPIVDMITGWARVLPDGRNLLFLSRESGPTAFWVAPLGGGAPREIPQNGSVYTPSVMRDGRLFFVARFNDDIPHRIVCTLPACDDRIELQPLPRGGRYGAMTPDGAATTGLLPRIDESRDLWAFPIDGSAPRKLTSFSNRAITTWAFSPDGKRLAVARTTGDHTDVVLLRGIK